MAESRSPAAESASELYSPSSIGAVGSDCPADGAIFPLSKSSVDMVTSPLHQDELRKSSSSPTCSRTPSDQFAKTPVTNDYQGGRLGEPGGPGRTQQNQGGPHGGLSGGHRAERPRSIAETAPSHRTGAGSPLEASAHSRLRAGDGGAAVFRGPSSSHRDLREEQPGPPQKLGQRSLSASLHTAREAPGPCPRRSETGAPCPGAGYCGRDAPRCPTLVCKQPMQLLQSNTMTTCHSNSPTQQQGGGVRICVPSPPHGEGDGEAEARFHGHGGLEDTFAAYCHSLPIPTPAQLLPCPTGAEGGAQRPPPHLALLSFPRLISSVSETGLDAQRVLGCCRANCPEQGGAYPIPPRVGGGAQPGEAKVTRETGTMTSRGELRDVGVQTGPVESPPAHVFPEVSLAADEGGGAGEADEEESNGAAGGQKSPIKEVMWDAEGMTWEVYGASVDPEELGLAIQKHLELQIKEKAGCVAKLTRQDTITSQQSRRRRKRGFTMASLRNPTCCARSSAVVD